MRVEVLLIFAAVTGFATAEVPSYIHVCGARNPKFDQCVIDSVAFLAETLKSGIPELDVPPSEPFEIENLTLADMPSFKAFGTNVKIYGLPTYVIKFLHIDLKKPELTTDLLFRHVKVIADYDLNAKLLIPINGRGPIIFEAHNVIAKVKMGAKIIKRNNKRYIYFESMQTKLDIKDFKINFEVSNFDKTLQEALKQALGGSHQEIIETTSPYIEKAISEKCLDVANKICKHFTYEELFPDRE